MTQQIVSFNYDALGTEARIVVRQKTSEIRERLKHIRQNFIEIGERLIAVKTELEHGEWGAWLNAEFGWSQDTAERLMNAARLASQIPQIAEFSENFTRTAMYVLGATTTPPMAVNEAAERAAGGEQINDVKARQIIAAHKPSTPINTRPAGVRANGDGVEPDLDEDGQPLIGVMDAAINDQLAEQVELDDEDEDDSLRVGDIVQYGGQRFKLRSVASSGRVYFDVAKSHKLHGKGIESEDVLLIERAPDRRRGVDASTPPVKPPLAEEIAMLDGVPIVETHPEGFRLFYTEGNWATCVKCGESHPRWSAVRGGDWRCEQRDCKQLTHDDLLIPYTKEDSTAEDRNARRNGNGHKPAPTADPLAEDDTNDEWYTPDDIIAVVREFLGGIDVDPASCDYAQRRVKAQTYYTKRTDGLIRDWRGRVWLNPPYSYPLVEKFTGELLRQYRRGIVEEAIVLVNNRTDAAWFQTLLVEAVAVFVSGRINFERPGVETSANRQGQVFFYLGKRNVEFANAFGCFGVVVRCVWDRPEE